MWQRGLCSSDGVEDLELRRFSWILWVVQCNQDPHKERETQEVRVRAEDVTEAERSVHHGDREGGMRWKSSGASASNEELLCEGRRGFD